MKPRSCKNKGKYFQNKIMDKLRNAFHTLEDDDIKSQIMGVNGEDIMLSPAARKLIPYSFECKKNKAFSILKYMEQAIANSKGFTPVVVFEQDRGKPYVVIDFEHFLELISHEDRMDVLGSDESREKGIPSDEGKGIPRETEEGRS